MPNPSDLYHVSRCFVQKEDQSLRVVSETLSKPSLPILHASWIMTSMGQKMTRPQFAGSAFWAFVVGCAILSLVGCTSGTLSGTQQSCESTFGVLEAKKVSCTGSVDTVSGSPPLSVIEIGESLNGTFRLETTVTVGQGTAKASVTDVDDQTVESEVSPGKPLRIVALVYPDEVPGSEGEEERVDLQIEVAEGQEVTDLRYEATLVSQN
jgi:hypothetical protein